MVAALAAQRAGFIGAVPFPKPPAGSLRPPAGADFVGAERCAPCHAAEYARWRGSTHGRAGGAAAPDLVIAAFNGRALRFADARVVPRRRGAAYEFVISQDGEADQVLRVDGVVGGGHLEGGGTQGFVTHRDDGTVRFLPFDWSRHGARWFCNTNSRAQRGWVAISPALRLTDCGDWPPVRVLGDLPRYANCQGCHASQLGVRLDSATHRYDVRFTSLAINCESCHGPGRRHVELADRGELARGSDIGFAALATSDKEASLRVCFQCHAVKDQLREGFLNGAPLEAYYSLGLPALGDRPLHADGRVRTFAYQEGHRFSACYMNGGMTCTSCHEPHGQGYRDVFGAPLAGRFDDRQCTSCHPSKAADPASHTHHAAGSVASRCTSCHMPYLQERETGPGEGGTGIRYARSDHTISVPRPALDSALGIHGACASCHADRSAGDLERAIRGWYGEAKPVAAAVRGQLEFVEGMPLDSAWPRLLGAAADSVADAHVAARIAGIARFFEGFVRPDQLLPAPVMARLRALSVHRDADVRALALAARHLSTGSERATRRELRRALAASDVAGDGVRSRWAVALGFAADRLASAGEGTAADIAYRRALEVAPGDAHVWLNRANAQRAAGALDSALASYHRALALDPQRPLAWLNYGIALTDAADTSGGMEALRRAVALEPGDALGYYNLGNIAYVRGKGAQARALYEQAVARDQSLTLAHFQLARLQLAARDAEGAFRSLRRGLAFDSSDASARKMAAKLAAMLGGR
jgi:Tfp pilus assembly protein PilF